MIYEHRHATGTVNSGFIQHWSMTNSHIDLRVSKSPEKIKLTTISAAIVSHDKSVVGWGFTQKPVGEAEKRKTQVPVKSQCWSRQVA